MKPGTEGLASPDSNSNSQGLQMGFHLNPSLEFVDSVSEGNQNT